MWKDEEIELCEYLLKGGGFLFWIFRSYSKLVGRCKFDN